MLKKSDWKAVLSELANDPPRTAKTVQKTAESLLLKAEVSNLKKKLTESTQAVSQLYTNLLTEEAHQPWDVIIKEQTESSLYTNIFGVKWRKSPGNMFKSFQKCQLLHLQSCFTHDAGET